MRPIQAFPSKQPKLPPKLPQQPQTVEQEVDEDNTIRLDAPPPKTEPLRTNVTDPSDQTIAVTHGTSQNPFVKFMMIEDMGNLIIDLDIGGNNLTTPRDEKSLKELLQLYHHLNVNNAMSGRVRKHPSYGAWMAQIKWLWNLNHLSADAWRRHIPKLIDSNIKVRLPGHPNAPRRRTDLLVQRVISCTSITDSKNFLRQLFEKLKSSNVVDGLMFIDLQHVALSAISAAVRRFGFNSRDATEVLDPLVDTLGLLPLEDRAACWAELAYAYEDPQGADHARDKMEELTSSHSELSAFRQFMNEKNAFLTDPTNASYELRGTMIAHLEMEDTSWTPSNVLLLEFLTNLAQPMEGVTGLSEEQCARVQRILAQYMEALNAMHTDRQMTRVRELLSKRIHNKSLLISAFSELAIHDQVKIVDIREVTPEPDGFPESDDDFLEALTFWMPMIRSTVENGSFPLNQRNDLVMSLLAEAVTQLPSALMGSPKVLELSALHDALNQ